jgi:hypothetical protein
MPSVELVYRPNNTMELFVAKTHLEAAHVEILQRKPGLQFGDKTSFKDSYARNGLPLLADERTSLLLEIKSPLKFATILNGTDKKDPLKLLWRSLAAQMANNLDSCQWWIRVLASVPVIEQPLEIIHHGASHREIDLTPPTINAEGFEYETPRSQDLPDFDARSNLFLSDCEDLSLAGNDPNEDTQVIEFDDDHVNETTQVLEEINIDITNGDTSLLDEEIVLEEEVKEVISKVIDDFDFLFAQAFEWDGGASVILGV